jgi:serine/threonine-protein kinase RsbW
VNSCYHQFEVLIPNDYEAAHAVVERIANLISEAGFKTREIFGIRLSVDEAVANAIKHGNQFDPEKVVRVAFQLNEYGVRIEVEDQGPGFHPEDVPDPTDDENLEKPSGRGLMLMREFMTRIEYSPKGNLVILEKLHQA